VEENQRGKLGDITQLAGWRISNWGGRPSRGNTKRRSVSLWDQFRDAVSKGQKEREPSRDGRVLPFSEDPERTGDQGSGPMKFSI